MYSLKIADIDRDIVGADRGYNTAGDILTKLADGTSLDTIWDELQTALNAWNTGRSAVAALFSSNTTDSYELLPLDGGRVDLERASEFGVPQAGRVKPGYYPVGFDLAWYDFATRYTRKFLRDAKAPQISSQHVAAQEGDNRLIFNQIMTAIMTPTGDAFGERGVNPEGQTIYSLYSGASDDKPPTAPDGTTFAANHTHFLVSGATLVDSGDLDDLLVKITEHGRGTRESGERIVILLNKQEGAQIRKFRANEANNNGAVSTYDFIATANEPAYLTDLTLVGERPPSTFNGLNVIGSYGDALIVQHTLAKPGFLVAVAAGGEAPLAFRQHPVADNQGFRLVQGPLAKYPLIESIYERGFGVGIRRRDAAAVMQIKASGTYQAPVWF